MDYIFLAGLCVEFTKTFEEFEERRYGEKEKEREKEKIYTYELLSSINCKENRKKEIMREG